MPLEEEQRTEFSLASLSARRVNSQTRFKGEEQRERLFDSTGTTETDDAKRRERDSSRNCQINLGKPRACAKYALDIRALRQAHDPCGQ